ncbi:hypothetical protein C8R26_13812 [Nitrosomonas oligotropha]|uniref:Uncharacterized protein n=1 Tax=Nitrosomonas oligotropha TaxID=42354 RepID=A0A2T5H9X2_9PROT|nr:hypothetical protein [Nitrosomonas oligotropha]PTQ68367.1 hypothetical protein C8R26_13812 [Nitrosomonas oligotropha]
MTSERIDNDHFLSLTDKIETVQGIWDLPLIGAEELDIEHRYQILTGGPAVTLQGVNGCFVQSDAEEMFQLQECFDDNKYQLGSLAALEELKERIVIENIEKNEAETLLEQHKEARKKYLESKENQPKLSNYYPAGGLPQDSVLVVRTAALREFEQKIADEDDKDMKGVKESTRKTDNLLSALTAIAIDDYGYDPESPKSNAPQDIAEAMSKQGISFDPRTIRNWLREGAALLPSKRYKN